MILSICIDTVKFISSSSSILEIDIIYIIYKYFFWLSIRFYNGTTDGKMSHLLNFSAW